MIMFFKKKIQTTEKPKEAVYELTFSVNGITQIARNKSLEPIEKLRAALVDGMAKAVEGEVFVYDLMGYAAGQVKSYTISKIETKESE